MKTSQLANELIAKLREENAKLKHLVSEMCTVIETDESDVDDILDRAYEALGSSRVHDETFTDH